MKKILTGNTEQCKEWQQASKSGEAAADLTYLKKCGIQFENISRQKMSLTFEGTGKIVESSTTFKELYKFFICSKERHSLLAKRIVEPIIKYQMNRKEYLPLLEKIWKSKIRKPFEKNFLYRFLFLGIRDKNTLETYRNRNFVCRFCDKQNETHEHLIFHCPAFETYRHRNFPTNIKDMLCSFESENMKTAIIIVMASWNTNVSDGLSFANDMLL